MVDQQFRSMEWTNYVTASTSVYHRTDASTVGWGTFCQGEATGGCWTAEEPRLHINKLKLLAVSLALKSFLKEEKTRSILVKSDTMTSGGPHKQARWNKIPTSRSPNQGDLHVVHGEKHKAYSATPTGEGQ